METNVKTNVLLGREMRILFRYDQVVHSRQMLEQETSHHNSKTEEVHDLDFLIGRNIYVRSLLQCSSKLKYGLF